MFIFKKFTPHPPRQEQEHPVVKVSVVLLWLKMGQELTLSATPETGMTVPGEADVMIAYLSRKFPDTFLPSLMTAFDIIFCTLFFCVSLNSLL